jgi:uncharacterized membrane protein HdeD (DUF308 family)
MIFLVLALILVTGGALLNPAEAGHTPRLLLSALMVFGGIVSAAAHFWLRGQLR